MADTCSDRKCPDMSGYVLIEDHAALTEAATKRGVEAALKALGLVDEAAPHDIRDLRVLLTAWRETKDEIWKTILRWIVTAVLGGIGLALYYKVGAGIVPNPGKLP